MGTAVIFKKIEFTANILIMLGLVDSLIGYSQKILIKYPLQ
jgi:hypothetical protein